MMPNPRLVSDFPLRDAPCGPGRYPNAMYERLRRFPGAGQNDRREGWKCNGTPHRKRLGWRRDHIPPAIGPVIHWPCCGARIGRMVGEQAAVHPRPTRTTSNPAGLYRTEPAIGPPSDPPSGAAREWHRLERDPVFHVPAHRSALGGGCQTGEIRRLGSDNAAQAERCEDEIAGDNRPEAVLSGLATVDFTEILDAGLEQRVDEQPRLPSRLDRRLAAGVVSGRLLGSADLPCAAARIGRFCQAPIRRAARR